MSSDTVTRRTFVQSAAATAATFALPHGLFAWGSDTIRVGLIGCGGRGTGAARDCLRGSEGVELVAMGDLVADRLEQSRAELAKAAAADATLAAKYKVTPERCFTGFDAYEKVLKADVHMVILATPPGFRPQHLAAAVAAGKHIFAEKPVATDADGVRSVLSTYELAKQKNLGIGVGTQRRHQAEYLSAIQRVHDGAIGEVLSGQVYWNQGPLWNHPRKEEWSDSEWQIRNWLYFAWLSGDHIVEQHVHNLDVANWVLQAHPVRATGVGGRQERTDARYGHIYDHFAVDFEYASGARVMSMCRQIRGTRGRVGEHFIGTKGRSNTTERSAEILGSSPWKFDSTQKPVPAMQQEHTDLVASLRAGKPINELKQIAESTLTAIMGREAAYTGQEVTWDDLLKVHQNIAPPTIGFVPLEVPPVPMPGRTKLERAFLEGW